jgi:hypothetical protein
MEVMILKFRTESWSSTYKEEITCFIEEVKALKRRYKSLIKLNINGKMSSFKHYHDSFKTDLKLYEAKINELMEDIDIKLNESQ